MWDRFLARSTRELVDGVAGGEGRGRGLFVWLCGVHDCGKATPAFQRMWPEGARAVREAGLVWNEAIAAKYRWRHDRAGGLVLGKMLAEAGWRTGHIEWVWPLVAGHHGLFPVECGPPSGSKGQAEGRGFWCVVRTALLEDFSRELGFDGLRAVEPVEVPTRAAQLHLSGLVVMADWIASDEEYFKGVDDIRKLTLDAARGRALPAWERLRLRGGWRELEVPGVQAFLHRFKDKPRDSQVMVLEAARRMPEPGLLVVEAPMGEGKTKAALLAAEVLAARFGADGVFVGMPTQATCDPMFTQVSDWLEAVDPELAGQVALLHGKRRFNKEWQALVDGGGRGRSGVLRR